MKNVRNFWNWQGNEMAFTPLFFYIGVGLMFFIPIAMTIFKRPLISFMARKEKEKMLGFKNINSFFAFLGWLGLIYSALRITYYAALGYPVYWEYLYLHLCRIHILALSIILIIKKKEVLQYLAPFAFIGAVVALGLGQTGVENVKSDSIWAQHGYKFFNAGPDSFLYWDMFGSHLWIAVFPIYVMIAKNKRYDLSKVGRTIVIYFIVTMTMAVIDLGMSFIDDKGWQANYWYMAPDKSNPQKNVLGPITHWPSSLVAYPVLFIAAYYLFTVATLPIFGEFKKEYIKLYSKESFKSADLKYVFLLKNSYTP